MNNLEIAFCVGTIFALGMIYLKLKAMDDGKKDDVGVHIPIGIGNLIKRILLGKRRTGKAYCTCGQKLTDNMLCPLCDPHQINTYTVWRDDRID